MNTEPTIDCVIEPVMGQICFNIVFSKIAYTTKYIGEQANACCCCFVHGYGQNSAPHPFLVTLEPSKFQVLFIMSSK